MRAAVRLGFRSPMGMLINSLGARFGKVSCPAGCFFQLFLGKIPLQMTDYTVYRHTVTVSSGFMLSVLLTK